MGPDTSTSAEDQVCDLHREVAHLRRLNDNLNARIVKEVSAYEATIMDLQKDLKAARQKRASSDSRYEAALHTSHEHEEARERAEAKLAAVEQENVDILAGMHEGTLARMNEAMEEAEKRFRLELAAAFVQVRDAETPRTYVPILKHM